MSRSLNSYKSLEKNKKKGKPAGKYVSKNAASLNRDNKEKPKQPPVTT